MNLFIVLAFLLGDDLLLSDFEGKDYGAWTTTGTAFGTGPARGALPNQMPVGGFLGKGLVNSYLGGDGAVGTLTSPPFKIERKALNFLIGGGQHPSETCINLLLDGKVVRTSTGRDNEHLEWDGWDVEEFAGRTAVLEIVDRATGGWGHINVDQIVQSDASLKSAAQVRRISAEARYLHLPVRTGLPKRRVKIEVDGTVVRDFEIELADRDPQFWACVDLAAWKGRSLSLNAWGPPALRNALDSVSQDEQPKPGSAADSETQRPQFHFTSRRGWLNDPNGMVYLKGEWHLYYQHNPYGWGWGNMHWGHAVSRDLVHWEELPIALYPAKFGDWAFSGSALVDVENTSGFKTGDEDVLVAAYTSTGRGECIVYSNDRGRTWTEYPGNPVVKHQGRDPRLLWHAATKQWVMAIYHEEGKKQSIAFHTSPDLKTWTFRSMIDGFYECPDLFELPVDGDATKTRWVLLAADGRYLLGSFDGSEFKPDGEKRTVWYGHFYASQTFSNAPGNRRVQIGWARGTDFPGMPYNQQMNVPVELTLKTTAEGLRMLAAPVKEIELLRSRKHEWSGLPLKPGENPLQGLSSELAELALSFKPGAAERVSLDLRGVPLVYDVRKAELTAKGLRLPLPPVDGVIRLRVLVDRGSVELFANDGLAAACIAARPPRQNTSFSLAVQGESVEVERLEFWELR